MCDTVIAPPASTAEHCMLFGKNSDRQRNEAQTVEYFPCADHGSDAQLACTYITIPQARRTYAVLLCRPFWIWGAEMGANEHGVVIGNEAMQARSPAQREEALIGMDLVRLALERAASAAEAVQVMTTLLARHGQGGNCGHLTPSYYNNGFTIVDATEAFVLETVGREWLLERVGGVRAIPNRYSIGRETQGVSSGLRAMIRESGWSAEAEPVYADAIADVTREHIGNAAARGARSTSLLRKFDGRLGVAEMVRILRDHGSDEPNAIWHPRLASTYSVCMHAGADDRPGQTVGTLISELHRSDAVHWVSGTAAPCTSIFKPVLLDAPLPLHGPRPTDRFDPRALWWRHEKLHRAVLTGDFGRFLDGILQERNMLEADFRRRVQDVLKGGSSAERSQVIDQCWREATGMEDRWFEQVRQTASTQDTPYAAAWLAMNQIAGMP